MRKIIQSVLITAILGSLGSAALAANFFYVQPKPFEMSKTPPITVVLAASTLPQAIVGLPFNAGAGFDLKPFLAVTGDAAFSSSLASFTLISGELPAGLTLSSAGVLAGTPTGTSAGSSIQVRAAYRNVTGLQTYSVMALNLSLSLAPATLPTAAQNSAYSSFDFKSKFSASGDPGYDANQVVFTLFSGSLPVGMGLSSAGILSGTPSGSTGTNFTVQAAYKLKTIQTSYSLPVTPYVPSNCTYQNGVLVSCVIQL